MQENYIFIENQQYFDVPEDEDGLPKFYNQNPVFQEDLEIDENTSLSDAVKNALKRLKKN